MNIKERKLFSLYTSKKYIQALDFLAKIAKKSKAQVINELIKKHLDENRQTLEKKKINYE